jgi:hypothetical protein
MLLCAYAPGSVFRLLLLSLRATGKRRLLTN